MTLWTSPVPMHLSGKDHIPAVDNKPSSSAEAQEGGDAALGDALNTSSSTPAPRRRTLPAVPSAAQVQESQEKFLEFAPTSSQRRASFVSEPGAIDGNPFEIYKEPARTDTLGTSSFYEAGASYAVKEHTPAAPPGPPAQQPPAKNAAFGMSTSGSTTRPESLQLSRPGSRSGNPFYEAPLSPIRYNKPIAKVELSPHSTAMSSIAFGDLDPLKRAESPTAQIPLDQLKISSHNEQLAAAATAAAQQQQEQQQWGAWPHQPQPTVVPQQQQQQQAAFGFAPPPVQQQQQQQQPNGWADFGAPPVALAPQASYQQQPPSAQQGFGDPFGWPAGPAAGANGATASAAPKTPNTDDFNLLAGARGGGAATAEAGGAIFDPVRQKSLAESSFDLGVGAYFPEAQAAEEEEEEGPVDHPDEDDDGSMGGDGHGGLDLQDDHFHHEGGDVEGSASGMHYEVAFNAPTTFGMLLERKDEWTRGAVARRERTVVTLVVEGGEAEAKGVGLGSMIASINGEDVTCLTYKETLERIKSHVRPMRVVFERESLKEEVLQGYYFVSKGPFFSNPTTMDKWKRKYVVLGGPIAKKNVLQIYDSKRAYHNTVVALFQRKRPAHRVKTYALTYAFKLSPLQERKMEGHTAPLKFFAFMTPAARFKSIRIASETRKNVQELHERFGRFAGQKGGR